MLSVGLNVVNFGPAGDARSVGDTILRAEASGFDLAMVSDHVAVTPDVNQSHPAPFLEAFSILLWVSAMDRPLPPGGFSTSDRSVRHLGSGAAIARTGRGCLGRHSGWR